ncbi:MAG: EAL domain-containing protein [Eubacterium sp.]|nr:EAL domain-containing protein [Eubacterium sp.]
MGLLNRLRPSRYYKYIDEVSRRNIIASDTFLMVGFILSSINMLSNIYIHTTNSFIQGVILLVYFSLATAVRKFVIKDNIHRSLLFLYSIQIPVMIFSIFMGTIWDRDSVTISFFLLLVCMPLFILDNPIRHIAYICFCMLIYAVMCYLYKSPEIFKIDIVHAICFLLGSIFVDMFVLAERFDNIENYVMSEERARCDELSGLKNRYALTKDLGEYVEHESYVGILDIDYFKFFNDIYGHNMGEGIFGFLSEIVRDIFDEDVCYRYESDEVLIIYRAENEENFKAKLKQVQERFKSTTVNGKKFHTSCSIGYVFGVPVSEKDVSEMIRHADVRLLEAKNSGRGTIRGYEYDRSVKRQTDILTEVNYNINKSSIDELTGLPNMQFFWVRADDMLTNLIDLTKEPVFIYFNLTNFKSFNEEYGFHKGDRLLQNIALILREEFDKNLISRFAEDHFVVLTYKEGVEESLARIKDRVLPLFGNVTMRLEAGIYVYDKEEDIGIACDKAKLACDSILTGEHGAFLYYNEALENKSKLQQYVVSHIDEAIENGYLKVYYQPIVDIDTGQTVEVEALARWIDPVYGFLSPADFIPVLEEARLIHKIDMFIAKQVCMDQSIIAKKVGRIVPASINISRLDFMLIDVLREVQENAKHYNVDTKNIHIEITESALEDDREDLIKKINALREVGFEIWLDDFGSGYSSLNVLQDFNFDVIKVDMRFMRTLEGSHETEVIVRSIIDMSKNLGLKSLVEGVETEKQYMFLKAIGTDLAQGFLFSRPVPIEEIGASPKS